MFLLPAAVAFLAQTTFIQGCCMPERMEGVSVGIGSAAKETVQKVYFDYSKNLILAASMEGLHDWFVLIDRNTDRTYNYQKGECTYKPGTSTDVFGRCLPQNAEYLGNLTMGNVHSGQKVRFYKAKNIDDTAYLIRGLDKNCLPQMILGDSTSWQKVLVQLYFNMDTVVTKHAAAFSLARNIIMQGCRVSDTNAFK